MLVYLLRHGTAEGQAPGQSDAQRPLTADGRDRLQRACRVYRRLLQPLDVLRSSPLLRAQQTAKILADELRHDHVDTEPLLVPEARPQASIDLLQADLFRGAQAVALVGHEPHLGSLLGLLLGGSERFAVPLKKGMLVAVEIDTAATMLGRLQFALGQRLAGALQ